MGKPTDTVIRFNKSGHGYEYLTYDTDVEEFIFSADASFGSGTVQSDEDIYINYDGPDGDSNLYYYDGSSSTGQYLRWDDDPGRFVLSEETQVEGDVRSEGDIYVNCATEQDSHIYFYEGGSAEGASLTFNDTSSIFVLSHSLTMYNARFNGTQLWINHDGSDSDCKIYFYNDSDPEDAFLRWDDTSDIFHFSHGLNLDTGNFNVGGDIGTYGDVHINIDYGTSDAVVYFYRGSPNKETLHWDYADNRFEFSSDVYIKGMLRGDNNLFLNQDYGDVDVEIAFGKTGSTYEVFKWDKTDLRFELTDTLYVSGDFEVTTDVYINKGGSNNIRSVYFYHNGDQGKYLRWDGSTKFQLNDELEVTGTVTGSTGVIATTGDVIATASDVVASVGSVYSFSDIYVNSGGVDAIRSVYFRHGGADQGRWLRWNSSLDTFQLNDSLSMLGAKITSLGTPSASDDACTKGYADSVGGGSQSLQDVCDVGNTTTTNITCAELNATGQNVYIDSDGNNSTPTLYFRSTSNWLQWHQTNGYFQFNQDVGTQGNLYANIDGGNNDSYVYFKGTSYYLMWDDLETKLIANTDIGTHGNIYVNYNGGDVDSYIYFYETGPESRSLKWEAGYDVFEFNGDLTLNGNFNFKQGGTKLYINSDGGDADCYIYFYKTTNEGRYFGWSNTSDYFVANDSIVINPGDIASDRVYVNFSGSTSDSYVFFHNGTSPGRDWFRFEQGNQRFECSEDFAINMGNNTDSVLAFYNEGDTEATLIWDIGDDRFIFNNDVYSQGTLRADENLFLNQNYGNVDVIIYFGEIGSTYETLTYNKTDTKFELSKRLDITGDLVASGDVHAQTDVKSDAAVFLNYTAGSGNSFVYFKSSIGFIGWVESTDNFLFSHKVNVAGEVQCDDFRLDQTPTNASTTPTHYFTVSLNGTTYRVPCEVD